MQPVCAPYSSSHLLAWAIVGVAAPSQDFPVVYDPTSVNTRFTVRATAPAGIQLYVLTVSTSNVLKADTGTFMGSLAR